MAVTADELKPFQGQKVRLVRNPPGSTDAVELIGTAEVANEAGVLLKPKGRQNLELIEIAEIEEIAIEVEKPKELKVAEVLNLTYGQARTHLVNRHGLKMSEIKPLGEEDALKFHATLDHSDLSHTHVAVKTVKEKPAETPDETAEAQPEPESVNA